MASEVPVNNHAKFVSSDPTQESAKPKKKRVRKPKVVTDKDALDHQAIKEAKKNERLVAVVPGAQKTPEQIRKEKSLKTPFAYYYNVAQNVSKQTIYCNISQFINDKNMGRIYQPQYFAIAEQSDRIFEINRFLITHAKGVALLHEDMDFVVQVSAKYLENRDNLKLLEELIQNWPSNLIMCFDARTLVIAGKFGRRNLHLLVRKYNLRIMLDQVETERMTVFFNYPIKYIRLDARYYKTDTEAKTAFVKLIKEYCVSQQITLCARYVDTKPDRSWAFASGVEFIEGQIVQNIQGNLSVALK